MSARGFPITKEIMARRRADAENRQKEYDLLTLQQKFDKLPPAPAAKKVRAKLQLQADKAKQVAPPTKSETVSDKKSPNKNK
jgi:hypothetical protein